jgi:hypothetical protein
LERVILLEKLSREGEPPLKNTLIGIDSQSKIWRNLALSKCQRTSSITITGISWAEIVKETPKCPQESIIGILHRLIAASLSSRRKRRISSPWNLPPILIGRVFPLCSMIGKQPCSMGKLKIPFEGRDLKNEE